MTPASADTHPHMVQPQQQQQQIIAASSAHILREQCMEPHYCSCRTSRRKAPYLFSHTRATAIFCFKSTYGSRTVAASSPARAVNTHLARLLRSCVGPVGSQVGSSVQARAKQTATKRTEYERSTYTTGSQSRETMFSCERTVGLTFTHLALNL